MGNEIPPDGPDIPNLTLAELEAMRLVLRGGSVIDWHRLNFESPRDIERFIASQCLNLDRADDRARVRRVRDQAIAYLKRTFGFPVPGPVARQELDELLALASASGHRQLCACAILKVMHIIHHLEARELLFRLPTSDSQVFHLVEAKVYGVVGKMLGEGLPIVEFIGGRKQTDSLYSKLLSKQDTLAAQVYDKVRFRIVVRQPEDIYRVLPRLLFELFPFNYVIPGESYNTLLPWVAQCQSHPELSKLLPKLQFRLELEEESANDNHFSSKRYRVIHFVVDMPLALPEPMLALIDKDTKHLGRIIFAQAEFQLIDEVSDRSNEVGEASHAAYKARQKAAIAERLKLGLISARQAPGPPK